MMFVSIVKLYSPREMLDLLRAGMVDFSRFDIEVGNGVRYLVPRHA